MFSANGELSGCLCAQPTRVETVGGWGKGMEGRISPAGPQARRGRVVLAQLPVRSDTTHWQLVLLLQPEKPVTYNLLSVSGQEATMGLRSRLIGQAYSSRGTSVQGAGDGLGLQEAVPHSLMKTDLISV